MGQNSWKCLFDHATAVWYSLTQQEANGEQIVILGSPEIYSEYAPYPYNEDMKEFIDRVSRLNRAA